MRTTPGRRATQFVRHPIRRSERARVYADPHERRWSLYGRWLAWFGWRDGLRLVALLAGAIILALVNSGDGRDLV